MNDWVTGFALLLAGAALALALRADQRAGNLRRRLRRLSTESTREQEHLLWSTRRLLDSIVKAGKPGHPLPQAAGMEDVFTLACFADQPPGTFLEVGAYDGIWHSNSYLLEAMGWKGVLIEPIPERAAECRTNRPGSVVVQAACGPMGCSGEIELQVVQEKGKGEGKRSYVDTHPGHIRLLNMQALGTSSVRVPLITVDSAIGAHFDRIDVAFIDVEGAELGLLKGFSLNTYKPRLLIVEDNTFGHEADVLNYLGTQGYQPVGWIRQNRVYTRTDDAVFAEHARGLCPSQHPPADEPLWTGHRA
jgi:FkbM family methyltransferase